MYMGVQQVTLYSGRSPDYLGTTTTGDRKWEHGIKGESGADPWDIRTGKFV